MSENAAKMRWKWALHVVRLPEKQFNRYPKELQDVALDLVFDCVSRRPHPKPLSMLDSIAPYLEVQ